MADDSYDDDFEADATGDKGTKDKGRDAGRDKESTASDSKEDAGKAAAVEAVERARKEAQKDRERKSRERQEAALNATQASGDGGGGGGVAGAAYKLTLPGKGGVAAIHHPLTRAMLDGNEDAVDAMLFEPDHEMIAAPVDAQGRFVGHYAAYFSHPAILTHLLTVNEDRLNMETQMQIRDLREQEVYRKVNGGGEGDEGDGAHADWFTLEVERLERLHQLRREDEFIGLLGRTDKHERTVLHYAAVALNVPCETLLDNGAGADFGAVGSSTRRPLFPPHQWVCTRCAMIVPADAAAGGGAMGGTAPAGAAASSHPDAGGGGVAPWDSRTDPTRVPDASTQHFGPGREFRAGAGAAAGGHAATADGVGAPGGAAAGAGAGRPSCYNRDCEGSPVTSLAELKAHRRDAINARDVQGGTPLHYASVAGDVRAAKTLLRHGGDRHAKDINGDEPLAMAAHRVVLKALMPLTDAVEEACAPPGTPPKFAASPVKGDTQGSRGGAGDHDDRGDEALRILVASGADVNRRSGVLLRSSLHTAAEKGNAELASYLLSVGAEIDQVDANGWTPLHVACEGGTMAHHAVGKLLLEGGANVNAVTNGTKTPLHFAAMQNWASDPPPGGKRKGSKSRSGGLDTTTATDGGGGASAAAGGDGEQKDADVDDTRDPHEVSVGVNMIRLLVSQGADIEARDDGHNRALHWACRKGRARAVQCLLTLGANLYSRNEFGESGLQLAVENSHPNVASLLCRHDAETGRLKRMRDCHNKRAADLSNGVVIRTAQETLWEAAAAGDLDLTASLARAGDTAAASSATAKPWGPVFVWEGTRLMARNALHCCVTGCAAAQAKIVRDAEAKRLGQRIRGDRGVPLAAGLGLVFKEPRGLQPPAPKKGSAVMNEIEDTQKRYGLVLSLLMRNGVDTDGGDNDGVTPLMLCAQTGQAYLAQLLLNNKANVAAADFDGNTALHHAAAFGQSKVAALLESAGADDAAVNAAGQAPDDVAGARLAILSKPCIQSVGGGKA